MTRSCRGHAAVAGALSERRSWDGLAQLLIGLAVGICLLASTFVAAAGASPDRSWSCGLAEVTTSVGTPIYAYDRIAGSRADARDGQLSTAAANAAARSVRSVQPDVGPLTSIGSRIATEAGSSKALVPYEQYPLEALNPRGFMGTPVRETLQPGTVITRYGGEGGTFVSPAGTPFSGRGLLR